MSGSSLIRELRCRHIFRIAAAYAVTAWLLIQLAAIMLPTFGAPHWVLKVVVGLLILFFPVALILAWAFEVTPDGMRRTQPDRSSPGARPPETRRRIGRILNTAIIVVLAAAVGVLAWRQFGMRSGRDYAVQASAAPPATRSGAPAAVTAIPSNSIAVLPFLDLSPRHNQEYFAEGIAEQLLDILAQATNLRVAARTSAFQFKGKPEDVTTIGKILRVRHVLEGSVRRDGDLVRITVQLIDARTDYHEWSKTYQRKMTDIFKVQDEISRAIANHLEAQLGPSAGTSAVARADPSTTPAAYEQYLLGRHLINERTGDSLRAAIDHLKKAVALDPDYASAAAQIAIAYSLLVKGADTYGNYQPAEASAFAAPYLRRAVALASEAADTQAAEGRFAVLVGNPVSGLKHFTAAVAANPSYMDAVTWKALELKVLGRYREAFATERAGVRRDPLNWVLNDNYAEALLVRGRFASARSVADRFLEVDAAQGRMLLGDVAMARGRAAAALKDYLVAMRLHPTGQSETEDVIGVLDQARLYEDARRLRTWQDGGIGAALAGDREDALRQVRRMLDQDDSQPGPYFAAGIVNLILGKRSEVFRLWQRALRLRKAQGGKPWSYLPGTLAYAALLRAAGKTAAAREPLAVLRRQLHRRQVEAETAGASWPEDMWMAAGLKLLDGEKRRGLAQLETAVARPLWPVLLWVWPAGTLYLERAPQFDSVRGDPRFQAIVEQAKRREDAVRAAILPVLCGWRYPADGWHPQAGTCADVHAEVAGGGS